MTPRVDFKAASPTQARSAGLRPGALVVGEGFAAGPEAGAPIAHETSSRMRVPLSNFELRTSDLELRIYSSPAPALPHCARALLCHPDRVNFLPLLEAKRDGHALSAAQVTELVNSFTVGGIPDYQMAAFLMAVFFRGMSTDERRALTLAMRDSGDLLTFPADARPLVDKHSTGGVGDKVSLPLAPLLACLGFRVPMISGRGLGITGGTLDKLESIPGFTTALLVAFELPALAWLAAVGVILGRSDLRRTLMAAAPAAALVAAAALGTNYLAHGTVVPAYAHRTDAIPTAHAAATEESWNPLNWYDYAIRLPNGRLLESYWRSPKGIDRGEPSRLAYAWHAIAGHHGVVSLTPAWLLVIPGLALLAARRRRDIDGEADIARAIAAVSVVVIVFYVLRPQPDRNYGGMTSGFRWLFWMAPLWAVATVPAADVLGRSRAGRITACVLLGFSVLSAAYPTWNPWTAPWIEQLLRHAGSLPSP